MGGSESGGFIAQLKEKRGASLRGRLFFFAHTRRPYPTPVPKKLLDNFLAPVPDARTSEIIKVMGWLPPLHDSDPFEPARRGEASASRMWISGWGVPIMTHEDRV